MSMYGTHAPQQEDQQKAWRDSQPGEAADVCIAQSEKYDDVLDIHVDSGEIDG